MRSTTAGARVSSPPVLAGSPGGAGPALTCLLGKLCPPQPWSARFQHYGRQPREETPGTPAATPELGVGAGQTIGGVIAEFESACAASRRIAAGFALDQTVPHDQLGQVSLRFIYMHIISEHALHAGHADILREQIDGSP